MRGWRITGMVFGLLLGVRGGLAFTPQWTQASNGLTGSIPGVTALIIDRSTGSTFYALPSANSVFNVFKSADGGANWEALGNIASVTALALDPNPTSTIYAGTAHGVVKSMDAGANRGPAGLSDMPVSNLAVDPLSHSRSTLARTGTFIRAQITQGRGQTSTFRLPSTADLLLSPLSLSTRQLRPRCTSRLVAALAAPSSRAWMEEQAGM